ncbi:putative NOL1/NOP2/Sun domain family 2 [Blattamonas nauphoetae]|uniref:NOL1/NOP2/Sun domain family 2 n=1 Tax=Blattamonas nauphoetae TaxID=2049346 RepID=A0ABQ9X5U1_9EUKA|nr:putative NOL1/NOP2/Sun domain family 2 [Blattamonas nauphoetae]
MTAEERQKQDYVPRRRKWNPNNDWEDHDVFVDGFNQHGNKVQPEIIRQYQEYYRQLFETEDELQLFCKTMCLPLPLTFRLNEAGSHVEQIRDELTNRFTFSETITVGGKVIDTPHQLPWFPDGLGWGCSNLTKPILSKCEKLKDFFNWMKTATEMGYISRQEAVSMIPPLLLDVKPGQSVIDMCAAPGSKTMQIVEKIQEPQLTPSTLPTSLVVANDSDVKRCNILVHQLQRLRASNVVVVNHDASMFPSVRLNGSTEKFVFSRVLADVPCSGDGTLRKAPDAWLTWTTSLGHSLHPLQLKIARRSANMLAFCSETDTPRLVYSTCTPNPIEDEAVVAELLRTNKHLDLLDVSAELPLLKRAPGLSEWRVMDQGKWITSTKELSWGRRKKIAETVFPPSEEEKSWMHLERCIRVYPQFQDTGAFFIAVLVKKRMEDRPEAERETREKAYDAYQAVLREREEERRQTAERLTKEREETRQKYKERDETRQLIKEREEEDLKKEEVNEGEKRLKSDVDVKLEEQEEKMVKDEEENVDNKEETKEEATGMAIDDEQKTETEPLKLKDTWAQNDEVKTHMQKKRDSWKKKKDDRKKKRKEQEKLQNEAKETVKEGGEGPTPSAAPQAQPRPRWRPADDAFLPLPASFEALGHIHEFFGIKPEDLTPQMLMVRNQTSANLIYLVAPTARALLLAEEDDETKQKPCPLSVINAGIRLFEKEKAATIVPGACDYRLCQDGVNFLAPIIHKRKLKLPRPAFAALLNNRQLAVDEVEGAEELGPGTFILELDLATALPRDPPCVLCGLRGRSSLSLMVKTAEVSLLQALYPPLPTDPVFKSTTRVKPTCVTEIPVAAKPFFTDVQQTENEPSHPQ